MIDPAFIAKVDTRQAPTYVAAFGAAVREGIENGDVDYVAAAVEAGNWTFTEVYIAGFAAGADWYFATPGTRS
jgi:hypothetical protein